MSAEVEDPAHQQPGRDTGVVWRAASLWALGLAMLCGFGLYSELSGPRDSDWVTGAVRFFALLGAQAVTCIAGVAFGMLEMHRPSEQRDRWNGMALWANVLFACGMVSWLVLSRPPA